MHEYRMAEAAGNAANDAAIRAANTAPSGQMVSGGGGMDTKTLMLLGVAALGVVLLLRR